MKQKNYQNLTKNTLGKLPVWNLKDLYESPKAKNLNNDLNQLRRITKKFEKKYNEKKQQVREREDFKIVNNCSNISDLYGDFVYLYYLDINKGEIL